MGKLIIVFNSYCFLLLLIIIIHCLLTIYYFHTIYVMLHIIRNSYNVTMVTYSDWIIHSGRICIKEKA